MSEVIKRLEYTAEQIEAAVTSVYEVYPDKVGYSGVNKSIFIAYALDEKPDIHQAERIYNILGHLFEHKLSNIEQYENEEDLVFEVFQQKEYPLILNVTY